MVSELLEEGAFLEEIPSISNGGRDTFDESFDGLSPLSISESDFIEEEQLSEQARGEREVQQEDRICSGGSMPGAPASRGRREDVSVASHVRAMFERLVGP